MRSTVIYGFAGGYIASMAVIYLITGWFSLSFAVGSFAGILLFWLLLKLL